MAVPGHPASQDARIGELMKKIARSDGLGYLPSPDGLSTVAEAQCIKPICQIFDPRQTILRDFMDFSVIFPY